MQLSIVVPCYNEEAVLGETRRRLEETLRDLIGKGKIDEKSAILFVDDGSHDRTWPMIEAASRESRRVCGVKLSRNVGHQRALLAGLLTAEGDALISVDADLQDDVRVIEAMVDAFSGGKEIVYGVRRGRDTDGFFKRFTAEGYYRILAAMGVDVVFNHADFRLMGRRAIDALRTYDEVNLFLRGIVPTLGFATAKVEYDRFERFAGESKYPLRKMLALAIDGVTSFSAVPLRLIAVLGLVVFIGTLCMSIWVLWTKYVTGSAVPGWASSVLPMYLLGGIQLLGIGVVGEYVSKIYLETKRRPRYIVERRVGVGETQEAPGTTIQG